MTVSVLFPGPDERLTLERDLSDLLAASRRRVPLGSVAPTASLAKLHAELERFEFHAPVPLAELFRWTIAQLETGVVQMTHPRYLGLFNPAPTFPAQCADQIAAVFNPQLATATTSPAAVAIEAHVARAVAHRAGLSAEAEGHFTSGGSEANFTALVCALTAMAPDFAALGSRAFSNQPAFYVSQDCHLAWVKIAHQAGIGRTAVRFVPTDGCGRMSVTALDAAIREDRARGAEPFMIVATAGTTNAGMVDPLAPCAIVAQRHSLWFHVDAAWGGAAIASDRLRGVIRGIEQADSITIDAHKWLATTMGCGMFLTSRPTALSDCFTVSANYMPSHAAELDPYMTTAQWSRRFVGLRLFLSLAAAGWSGYAAHVERAVGLSRQLAAQAMERGWSVANDPALAVVCLEPPPGSLPVREIVRRVVASGGAWVSAARFEGRDIVRACVTHGETSPADIAAVMELLDLSRRSD